MAASDIRIRHEIEPFAYSLYPYEFDFEGEICGLDLAEFLPEGDLLPTNGPETSFKRIGFDVVQFDRLCCFGCSPLSCNGYAGEIEVNRYCLINDFEVALQFCKLCQEEQPEPGDYVVIEVRRK